MALVELNIKAKRQSPPSAQPLKVHFHSLSKPLQIGTTYILRCGREVVLKGKDDYGCFQGLIEGIHFSWNPDGLFLGKYTPYDIVFPKWKYWAEHLAWLNGAKLEYYDTLKNEWRKWSGKKYDYMSTDYMHTQFGNRQETLAWRIAQ